MAKAFSSSERIRNALKAQADAAAQLKAWMNGAVDADPNGGDTHTALNRQFKKGN